ncbi:MAG: hypothetical protein Q7S57_01560 [bacterium]|nr:hypothetical protein [bacterium]
MSKILGFTKTVEDLTVQETERMFWLLTRVFLGVDKEVFAHDLREKEVVMLLRRDLPNGEIVGFSTLMVLDLQVFGRSVMGVFSGDTVVVDACRCSAGFGVEIMRYFVHVLESHPAREVYYILMSKGWRTYRVLPFFFRHFLPRPDGEDQAQDLVVRDAFGLLKYPEEYDPGSGRVLFSRETQRLVPGSIDAEPPQKLDTYTRFFFEKNPTYLTGTELVCVAPIARANFTATAIRLLGSCRKQRREDELHNHHL